jgi:hypothetical protein
MAGNDLEGGFGSIVLSDRGAFKVLELLLTVIPTKAGIQGLKGLKSS